jgi:hypothetical protein
MVDAGPEIGIKAGNCAADGSLYNYGLVDYNGGVDHVAVMNPRWGLIEKILSGEKTIESRWLVHKSAPWLKVFAGDKVHFKNSGGPVVAMAEVEKVEYIDELTKEKSARIIKELGHDMCIKEVPEGKNYCVLMWLKNPRLVEPFWINKKGFGSAAAWLCVEEVKKVKIG